VTRFRHEVVEGGTNDWSAGRGWDIAVGYLVPLQAVVLLGWWFYLSATAYAPDTWFNPLDPYSVATVVLQWGIVLAALLLMNRWLVRRTLGEEAVE
jgi:neurotransmitter:Na+ symporter, NSS family